MFPGILLTLICSARRVKEIDAWSSGMHDVRFVELFSNSDTHFMDFLPESRYIQQLSLKFSPVQTAYAPDGQSMLYVSNTHYLHFLEFSKLTEESAKPEWHPREVVCASKWNVRRCKYSLTC